MREIKRGFKGAYTVLEDGKPVGEPFTGPGAKQRAMEVAHVASPPPAPVLQPMAQYDEGEAAASLEVPVNVGPVTNLTPFERATLARQAEERRAFQESERRRKANDLRTERDMAAINGVLAAKVKAVIVDHYKDDPEAEDTIAIMMRAIEPVLAAGKMGGRRERRLYAALPKRAA